MINISSPHPIRNPVFMKALRQRFHRSFGIPSPAWMLELGARLIKTKTELILKSRYVYPEKLEKAGYVWKYSFINNALENIKFNWFFYKNRSVIYSL